MASISLSQQVVRPLAVRPVAASRVGAEAALNTILSRVEQAIIARPSALFVINKNFDLTGLEKELTDAEELNKKQAIPQKLNAYISASVDAILKNNRPQELIQLFKLLCRRHIFSSMTHVSKVLDRLKEHYPVLEKFITGNRHIITPLGMERVLEIFEKTYAWPKGQISLQNIETLAERIQELRDVKDKPAMRAWILYSPKNEHLVPVFIKKDESGLKVCITDSKGLPKDAYWRKPFESSLLKGKQEIVYAFRSLRQRDNFTCPIFSLLDLRNILEGEAAGRDIFSFLEKDIPQEKLQEITPKGSTSRMFTFDLLPPDMMKVTQSCKQLNAYRTQSPVHLTRAFSPTFQRLSPTKELILLPQTFEAVFKSIDLNLRVSEEGDILNRYIQRKYLTCLSRLVLSLT